MDFIIELPYGNFDEATRRAVAKVAEINSQIEVGAVFGPQRAQLEFVRLRVHLREHYGRDNYYEYHWRLT